MDRFLIMMLYFDNYNAFRNNDSGFLVPMAALNRFIAEIYAILYKSGIWVSLCCFMLAALLIGIHGGENAQEYAKAKARIVGIIISVGVLCAIPWIINLVQNVFGGMSI